MDIGISRYICIVSEVELYYRYNATGGPGNRPVVDWTHGPTEALLSQHCGGVQRRPLEGAKCDTQRLIRDGAEAGGGHGQAGKSVNTTTMRDVRGCSAWRGQRSDAVRHQCR